MVGKKMMDKPEFYRVEEFDSRGQFRRWYVTDDKAKVRRLIFLDTKEGNVKVYRCNKNGNNYSGRRIDLNAF